MKDSEFFALLFSNACFGCYGHRGVQRTCAPPKILSDLKDLLDWLGWDENQFLDYIKYKEQEEAEFFIDIEEVEAYISNIEFRYDDY